MNVKEGPNTLLQLLLPDFGGDVPSTIESEGSKYGAKNFVCHILLLTVQRGPDEALQVLARRRWRRRRFIITGQAVVSNVAQQAKVSRLVSGQQLFVEIVQFFHSSNEILGKIIPLKPKRFNTGFELFILPTDVRPWIVTGSSVKKEGWAGMVRLC